MAFVIDFLVCKYETVNKSPVYADTSNSTSNRAHFKIIEINEIRNNRNKRNDRIRRVAILERLKMEALWHAKQKAREDLALRKQKPRLRGVFT